MDCDRYSDAIGQVVDGTASAETRRDVEAHTARCPRCASLLEDLRQVRELAGSLERLAPPAAAWDRIAREPRAGRKAAPAARATSFSRVWLPLAAAAALLLTVGIMLVLRSPGPGGSTVALAPTPAPAPAASEPGAAQPGGEDAELAESVQAELRQAEHHYEQAIVGLERLTAEKDVLDPQVAAALTKNLQVIDQAIDESRAALRTEPTSEPAQQSLFDAFRTKVTLLQDTIALINEMRKGNQAEAARIAEGLNKS